MTKARASQNEPGAHDMAVFSFAARVGAPWEGIALGKGSLPW